MFYLPSYLLAFAQATKQHLKKGITPQIRMWCFIPVNGVFLSPSICSELERLVFVLTGAALCDVACYGGSLWLSHWLDGE